MLSNKALSGVIYLNINQSAAGEMKGERYCACLQEPYNLEVENV